MRPKVRRWMPECQRARISFPSTDSLFKVWIALCTRVSPAFFTAVRRPTVSASFDVHAFEPRTAFPPMIDGRSINGGASGHPAALRDSNSRGLCMHWLQNGLRIERGYFWGDIWRGSGEIERRLKSTEYFEMSGVDTSMVSSKLILTGEVCSSFIHILGSELKSNWSTRYSIKFRYNDWNWKLAQRNSV